MPIYKQCPKCRKRIEVTGKCNCYKKAYKEYKKYRTDDKEQRFYISKEWKEIKPVVKDRLNGLDIYSYYILNTTEYGNIAHHIEPIKKNWDRRLDIDNLMYVTDSNHKIIHNLLNRDYDGTVRLMNELVLRYLKEFRKA